MKNINTTIDKSEINKFEEISSQWWDMEGEFKQLHYLNIPRLKFIKENLLSHFNEKQLTKLTIVDVGCGGGIASIPLANLGFDVTGIDASAKNIEIAKIHAKKTDIKISYLTKTAEDLANEKKQFDVVMALEIIEHVSDIELFLQSLDSITKKDGMIFISTINKNIKSFMQAIVTAEYILRMVNPGTHDFKKFVKPSQIINFLAKKSIIPTSIKGIKLSLFKQNWELSNNPDVNYIMAFKKVN